MQRILDQRAIDNLFAANAQIGPYPASLPVDDEQVYDFTRAGQISNDQMRAISLVNDHFARNVMHTLGAWLRTQIHVVLVAGEQMPYSEFLARVPEPAYVNLLRLEPLGSVGLLEMDLTLALTMIDLLLGGHGDAATVREMTDIENTILASVMEVILRELNAAWASVGLQFGFEKRDLDDRVQRLMSAGERTLCVSFEMNMLGVQGVLNFCLPAVALNTVHRLLVAVNEEPRPKFEATSLRVTELMGDARFTGRLRLPAVRIPSRAVQTLKAGMTLELPLAKNAQAELWVNGVRLCSAVAAARGGQRSAVIGDSKNLELARLQGAEPALVLEGAA